MHTSKSSINPETPELVIKSIFRRYDEDGNGHLDFSEFTNALDDLGIIDEYEQKALFALADADNSKTIEYDEFLTLIKGHDFEYLLSNREDYVFVIETFKTFQEYDQDADGEISWDEFYRYLSGHGYSHQSISQHWHYMGPTSTATSSTCPTALQTISFEGFWRGFKAQAEAVRREQLHQQMTTQLLACVDRDAENSESRSSGDDDPSSPLYMSPSASSVSANSHSPMFSFSQSTPTTPTLGSLGGGLSEPSYDGRSDRRRGHRAKVLGTNKSGHQRIPSLIDNTSWSQSDKNNIFRVMKRHLKKTKVGARRSQLRLGKVLFEEESEDEAKSGQTGHDHYASDVTIPSHNHLLLPTQQSAPMSATKNARLRKANSAAYASEWGAQHEIRTLSENEETEFDENELSVSYEDGLSFNDFDSSSTHSQLDTDDDSDSNSVSLDAESLDSIIIHSDSELDAEAETDDDDGDEAEMAQIHTVLEQKTKDTAHAHEQILSVDLQLIESGEEKESPPLTPLKSASTETKRSSKAQTQKSRNRNTSRHRLSREKDGLPALPSIEALLASSNSEEVDASDAAAKVSPTPSVEASAAEFTQIVPVQATKPKATDKKSAAVAPKKAKKSTTTTKAKKVKAKKAKRSSKDKLTKGKSNLRSRSTLTMSSSLAKKRHSTPAITKPLSTRAATSSKANSNSNPKARHGSKGSKRRKTSKVKLRHKPHTDAKTQNRTRASATSRKSETAVAPPIRLMRRAQSNDDIHTEKKSTKSSSSRPTKVVTKGKKSSRKRKVKPKTSKSDQPPPMKLMRSTSNDIALLSQSQSVRVKGKPSALMQKKQRQSTSTTPKSNSAAMTKQTDKEKLKRRKKKRSSANKGRARTAKFSIPRKNKGSLDLNTESVAIHKAKAKDTEGVSSTKAKASDRKRKSKGRVKKLKTPQSARAQTVKTKASKPRKRPSVLILTDSETLAEPKRLSQSAKTPKRKKRRARTSASGDTPAVGPVSVKKRNSLRRGLRKTAHRRKVSRSIEKMKLSDLKLRQRTPSRPRSRSGSKTTKSAKRSSKVAKSVADRPEPAQSVESAKSTQPAQPSKSKTKGKDKKSVKKRKNAKKSAYAESKNVGRGFDLFQNWRVKQKISRRQTLHGADVDERAAQKQKYETLLRERKEKLRSAKKKRKVLRKRKKMAPEETKETKEVKEAKEEEVLSRTGSALSPVPIPPSEKDAKQLAAMDLSELAAMKAAMMEKLRMIEQAELAQRTQMQSSESAESSQSTGDKKRKSKVKGKAKTKTKRKRSTAGK